MRTITLFVLFATTLVQQGCAATRSDEYMAGLSTGEEIRVLVGTNWALDIAHRVEFENRLRSLVSDRLRPLKVGEDPMSPYLTVFVHVFNIDAEGENCGAIEYVVDAAYTERVRISRPGRDQLQYATLWHQIAPGRSPVANLEKDIDRHVEWLVDRFVAGPVDARIERPEYAPPPRRNQ